MRRSQADLCPHAAKVPYSAGVLLVQARGELLTLAVGETAEGLAGRDPAVVQNLRGLDPPDLGDASSMSSTFALSSHKGGSSSSAAIDALPALRSRLSCARRVRISLAVLSASRR